MPFAILLALVAGATLPLHAAINARLGQVLGSPIWGAATSGVVSTTALVAVGAIGLRSMPRTAELATLPWWAWTGGLCGALFLTATATVAPRLGAATMTAAVVVGQMLCSVTLDRFGALGLASHPIDLRRGVATVLLIVGALLIR